MVRSPSLKAFGKSTFKIALGGGTTTVTLVAKAGTVVPPIVAKAQLVSGKNEKHTTSRVGASANVVHLGPFVGSGSGSLKIGAGNFDGYIVVTVSK